LPEKIDAAVRERALRLFADHRQDYPSDTALGEAVAKKVAMRRETAHAGGWVQADVNAGVRASKIPAEAACALRGTRGPDHAEPVGGGSVALLRSALTSSMWTGPCSAPPRRATAMRRRRLLARADLAQAAPSRLAGSHQGSGCPWP
jgi:transposase